MISFRLSSNAASRLFIVLRRLAGFSRCEGQCERDRREVTEAPWTELADDWRTFLASCLLQNCDKCQRKKIGKTYLIRS
jgi:hypothetical protein